MHVVSALVHFSACVCGREIIHSYLEDFFTWGWSHFCPFTGVLIRDWLIANEEKYMIIGVFSVLLMHHYHK